jgi:PucR C-terminal helix-turn-helix domain/GGDEF-like domain
MQKSEKSRPAACDDRTAAARDDAVRVIARRLTGLEEELARRIAARYRQEIVDYGAADSSVSADAAGVALCNLKALLSNLEEGEALSDGQLDETRVGAARRVHQGVSLEAFLHAARLWGQFVWERLRDATSDCPEERDAALEIASRVMGHVDLLSVAGAQAYLDEAQGLSGVGRVLRREFLEELLGGERDPHRARRQAGSSGVRLAENYVVILVRQPLEERGAMRWTIEAARTHLRPSGGVLLVGARDAEVVALYPVSDPGQVHTAKKDAESLAGTVAARGLTVGLSGWHPGLSGIALAYAEAKEAARLGALAGVTDRAVTLDEVLIDHIARFTPHVSRILDETLEPLFRYDQAHQSALVATVRAYVDAGFNLTRSAEVLHVHPNTVMYRLRRVRELSGRDPHDPDDLLILFLALKLAEVSP